MNMIGIISDIHSNVRILNQAIERLNDEKVSRIFVCGDVVGYGDQPNECCSRLQEIGACVVAGNHDRAVTGNVDYMNTFSESAIKGIEHNRKILSDANMKWLEMLPLTKREDNIEFVHASLHEPETWPYLVVGTMAGQSQWQDVKKCFAAMKGSICFVGHSHRPAVFLSATSGEVDVMDPFETWMDLSKERAVVDVGSISVPRDGSGYGHAFVFDPEGRRLKMLRINI